MTVQKKYQNILNWTNKIKSHANWLIIMMLVGFICKIFKSFIQILLQTQIIRRSLYFFKSLIDKILWLSWGLYFTLFMSPKYNVTNLKCNPLVKHTTTATTPGRQAIWVLQIKKVVPLVVIWVGSWRVLETFCQTGSRDLCPA